MIYSLKELTIRELYDLVDKNKIDLNPSYQRNFIWSSTNQMELIDTILKGYPLPNFFLYKKDDGTYEMVDGQQRTKTIYRFIQGVITASKDYNKIGFSSIDRETFLEYKIPTVIISDLGPKDSLREFYVLINKKGVHLNVAEVNKSEYHDSNFLRLANDLLSLQDLIDLDLFTDATAKRMNDRAYIEELLGYLFHGIKEKKKAVEDLYNDDITEEQYEEKYKLFALVTKKIHVLNSIEPISQTRYKQKNDFYTLFIFVHQNLNESIDLLKYQYRILIVLDGEDGEGRQFIRPSNDECSALREYANNCITQSNSKSARENRLNFFNAVLKNKVTESNEVLIDVLTYLSKIYGDDKVDLIKKEEYELLNVEKL